MRRTDEEFKAEVLRRSEEFKKRRKKRAKAVLFGCMPVVLCCTALLALSHGFGGSTEAANQMAFDAAQSVECAESPAAADQAAEEKGASGTYGAVEEPMEGQQIPEDFNIRFTWSIGAENVYDTYTGSIQKDLVLDGVAQTAFQPEEAVLEEIYWKLQELDIAAIDRVMTSEVLTTTDQIMACTPLTVYTIRFTMDGVTYTVEGDCTASGYPEDADAAHFMEFVEFMHAVMWETPEYQQLPETNGAYE